MFAVTVSTAFVVPPVGDTESQFPPEVVLAEAVNDTFGPVAFTFNAWLAGFEPPEVPVNVNVVGETVTVVRLKVTGTVTEEGVAPGTFTVIVPLLTPAEAFPGITETVTWGLLPVVPLVGETTSQFPGLEAETVNGTALLFEVETVRLCVAGVVPFTELKVNDVGVVLMVKTPGVTVNDTGIVCCGLPLGLLAAGE
jgi:hypothetical protein